MEQDRDDIIILIDENGDEVEVEHIDTIEYNGCDYVVLLPKEECVCEEDADCECEEEEVVILKVVSNGEEETFVAIEDEDEQNAVFEVFTQRMEEMDFDDDEFESFDDDDDEDEEEGEDKE